MLQVGAPVLRQIEIPWAIGPVIRAGSSSQEYDYAAERHKHTTLPTALTFFPPLQNLASVRSTTPVAFREKRTERIRSG